jgi:signal transduction histidine kinase/streptogramin lyase
MPRYSLIFFLYLTINLTKAQPVFTEVKQERGESIRNITCVFKDKVGFMWIGTGDGLLRYDGQRFLWLRHAWQDSLSLPSSVIYDIAEDPSGKLLVATRAGLVSLDPDKLTTERIYPKETTLAPSNTIVTSVMADSTGIWFGTYQGLYHKNLLTAELKRVPLPADNPILSLEKKFPQVRCISNIIKGKNNELWLATGAGVHRYNIRSNAWKYYLVPGSDMHSSLVQDVVFGPDSSLWFGTWSAGLIRLDTGKQIFQSFLFARSKKPLGARDIAKHLTLGNLNGQQGIWVASYDEGLCFFNFKTSKIEYIPTIDQNKKITSVEQCLYDHQGILWIGTELGLYKVDPFSQRFQWHGLADDLLKSDYAAVANFVELEDKRVLITVPSNGLYVWNRITNEVHVFPTSLYDKLENINQIIRLGPGKFFVAGRKASGVWYPNGDRFIPLPNSSLPNGLKRVNSVSEIFNGVLGLCSLDFGFYEFEINTNKLQPVLNTTDSARSIAVWHAHTYHDTVFLASSDGLWYYSQQNRDLKRAFINGEKSIVINEIFTIAGEMWVITDEGIFTWRHKSLQPLHIYNGVKMTRATTQAVYKQIAWIATTTGLLSVNATTRQAHLFTEEDGLKNIIVANFGMLVLHDGTILVGQNEGFFSFHPDSLLYNSIKPSVVLTELMDIAGRKLFTDAQGVISLDYDQNQFSFSLAALSFVQAQRNRYAFRLKGLNTHWTESSEATIAGLKGGAYTLELKAANNDGVWSEVLSIPIIVAKPFWERWWFLFSVFLLIVLLGYLLYRYELKKRLEVLMVRNRIASDLHDEVGSAISSISLFAGMARNKPYHETAAWVSQIEDTSRETINNMADIVWSIEPSNDHFSDVLLRMKQFGLNLVQAANMKFNFIVNESATKCKLDMLARKNVYLIFKEVVNNSVKYSRANEVQVKIERMGKTLHMRIADNGQGFDVTESRQGNGLRNIQRRANECKAELTIESSTAGTIVNFILPL